MKTEKQSRTWWIDPEIGQIISCKPFSSDYVRFKEVMTLTDHQAIVQKLHERIDKIREALSYYSNEMNYSIDDYRGVSGEMITRCILYGDCEERNDVYSYAGLRARQALKDDEAMG